ncbi:MAG: class I SAM-dependent methyltransferase [Anaerolineales bacterium]|jgi:23S rRNA (cytosine1962-C5)-methyltransferase|nr:class I SAM-dependent methyltransferase [Anaerolineales bacterium]MCC6986517.1 class I SAM-dependent methyltransferase [Anaerolineales bacterium]
MRKTPTFSLLEASRWQDYELLDSGDGLKLERFGKYTFARPESQAMWSRALPRSEWDQAHGVFIPSGEESGGHWQLKKRVDENWVMSYPLPSGIPLRFNVMTTPGRHLGVFPEVAAHWDFMANAIHHRAHREHGEKTNDSVNSVPSVVNVLNLFGYTGLASLAAAAAGASVTHVDASKKSVAWARENQELSGLGDRPIRWIVEDALKYVQREAKRGVKYDGIILDPPKFGRGPKGEVWEVYKSLPNLLEEIRKCVSDNPLFMIVTVYAVRASAIHVAQALDEMMKNFDGRVESGELVTREKSADRLLSQAVYARWSR